MVALIQKCVWSDFRGNLLSICGPIWSSLPEPFFQFLIYQFAERDFGVDVFVAEGRNLVEMKWLFWICAWTSYSARNVDESMAWLTAVANQLRQIPRIQQSTEEMLNSFYTKLPAIISKLLRINQELQPRKRFFVHFHHQPLMIALDLCGGGGGGDSSYRAKSLRSNYISPCLSTVFQVGERTLFRSRE